MGNPLILTQCWLVGGVLLCVWLLVFDHLPLLIPAIAVTILVAVREVIGRYALAVCRTASERGGMFCLRCCFDLHGLAETPQCPDCGAWYLRADLQDAWQTTEALAATQARARVNCSILRLEAIAARPPAVLTQRPR